MSHIPTTPWAVRSAFQVIGGSTAVVRDSSWDGFTRIIGPTPARRRSRATPSPRSASRSGTAARSTIRRQHAPRRGERSSCGRRRRGRIAEDNDIIDGRSPSATVPTRSSAATRIRQPVSRSATDGGARSGHRGSAGSGTAIVEGNTIIDSHVWHRHLRVRRDAPDQRQHHQRQRQRRDRRRRRRGPDHRRQHHRAERDGHRGPGGPRRPSSRATRSAATSPTSRSRRARR